MAFVVSGQSAPDVGCDTDVVPGWLADAFQDVNEALGCHVIVALVQVAVRAQPRK